MKPWQRAALIGLGAVALAAFVVWKCCCDPAINFLPGKSGAEWIVFPRPVYSASHPIVRLDTLFRRTFVVTETPSHASIRLAAAKRAVLQVNDLAVPLSPVRNWKTERIVDVTDYLRAGENVLEVRVFNDNAPAALWLSLGGTGLKLATDETWQASIAGSAWRPAALASAPRFPGPGNSLAGAETVADAWAGTWLTQFGIAVLAMALAVAGFFAFRRWPRLLVRLTLTATILIWLALFVNNARFLPVMAGFDAYAHVAYIRYIQEHHALPEPNQGYEMFQAPLFYFVSAIGLGAFHLSPDQSAGILLLRAGTFLAGIGQVLLVFASLRLLFPRRYDLQLVGIILAASLPMQLYLAHYATNETLAALFASATLYLTLRLSRAKGGSWTDYIMLGLGTGAALLTKASCWLLIPAIFGVLFVRQGQRPRQNRGQDLGRILVATAIMLLVCGWYYLRTWMRFGTPFLGNWDPASGFSWWQDPGYRTAFDYFRFGPSLFHPLFSSLSGFLDGIYATLWTDSLGGGVTNLRARPPWNYDIMVFGSLWAVLPTVLVLTGSVIALGRYLKQSCSLYFVLVGSAAAVAFGVFFMTLKVACFGQIKAFYGLAAVIPLCVCGVLGWQCLARWRLRFVALVLLLGCAINSFASFWIRPTPAQHMFLARQSAADGNRDLALSQANAVLATDPSNVDANTFVSELLLDRRDFPAATTAAQRAVASAPTSSDARLRLAKALAAQGQFPEATAEARRACEVGPEDLIAHEFLLTCLARTNRSEEIAAATREALVISPFSALLHYTLGLTAARVDDFSTALNQFGYAVAIRPEWRDARVSLRLVLSAMSHDAQAAKHLQEVLEIAWDAPALLDELAWARASSAVDAVHDGPEAVRLAERALFLTNQHRAEALTALAAGYAEMGRWEEAGARAQEALAAARSENEDAIAERAEALLNAIQARHSIRPEPKTR